MAYATDRVMLFDRGGAPLGDLCPDDLRGECPLYEKVNGEHTLTLETTRVLAEGTRLVFRDGTGKWREYVVNAPDDAHTRGDSAEGTYGCVWSLQYDLSGVASDGHPEPGMGSACSGASALACALEGTDRWGVGTVDVPPVAAGKGVVMIGKNAWERLSLVAGAWSGEVDSEITVGATGVTARAVALLSHLGPTTVTRRFDWAWDLASIRRTPEPGPRYCGILPLGRGHTEYAEDDETTIDWPLMLTDDPEYYPEYTSNYIYDPEASLAFRVPDGHGGWEYPVKPVRYDADDVGDLYELASADVYDQTHPRVTYESDVLQLARAGMDAQGVVLGEEVHAVDYGFHPGAPLRVEGRVMEMTVPLNAPRSKTRLVIGHPTRTMADELSGLISSAVAPVAEAVRAIRGDGTIVHVQELLDAINAEINATGGYTYLVPGIGAVTYDTAVSDPTDGDEASQATEMRGGTLRFANSRTSAGDWKWTNVITADGYLALAATIARLTSGYIGSAESGNYWNLDTGEFRMAATSTKVGTQTLAQYIGDNLGLDQTDVFNLLTNNGALQGLYMSGGNLYINASYIQTGNLLADLITSGKIRSANGKVYFDLTNNELVCDRLVSTSTLTSLKNLTLKFSGTDVWGVTKYGLTLEDSTRTDKSLSILPAASSSFSGKGYVTKFSSEDGIEIDMGSRSSGYSQAYDKGYLQMYKDAMYIGLMHHAANAGAAYTTNEIALYNNQTYGIWITLTGDLKFGCGSNTTIEWVSYAPRFESLYANGTKSRVVETKDYGDRLLHAYETPSPMFGDVGSATIGDDGTCVVSIDDVFSECARTDMAYQVFLQKCGAGDLWVSEKAPTHFIVEGTPGLSFDWELKAHQTGYEGARIDDAETYMDANVMGKPDTGLEDIYDDGYGGTESIERMYQDDIDNLIYSKEEAA